jgi:RNA polymerase sigma-70 factor (ECF subfamily)
MNTPTAVKNDRFEELVREHQAGLRAYIRALGAQDAWVDDLAQEVFLVAYRRLAHFEDQADFGRWLRGIARNLVLNERRKNARRSRLLQESLVAALDDGENGGPAAGVPAAQIVHAMADCVAHLPTRNRELLERRYAANTDTTTRIYYVQTGRNAILRLGDFCTAPVPLVATGKVEVKDGRLLFDAQTVEAGPPPSSPPERPNERVLFPF